ncbi:MAG TPA: putative nucleotidyltransferase substrate binding domain-containing protein [Actinomycetota bacterium]|nr:putative nucleotidyltransferase substrate binding domain-containing protein [Actinomycetota bacterium]
MDVRTFLLEHPPFDALSDEDLDRVVASVEIEHFAPGTVILRQAGAPATHLFVVRRGEVEILDDARVIDVGREGEVFGMWSLLGQVAPTASVRASQDTLCYLIDEAVASEVLRTGAGIAFVVERVRRRIARVDETLKADIDPVRYREVGAIVRRPPVTCEPTMPVADAAALMARERISSLLVPSPDGGVGILTDRDLRSRVVAERRGGDTRVGEVMTPRAETVRADAMAGEVLLRMLEGGFHHLPVEDGGGRLIGVVTDTDLMGVGRETPFALKSAVERAADRDGVVAALRELPRVVATLVDSSADPVDVGHVIAFSIDAATRRLIELGIGEFGEPPVRWTWLALGSAARQEQAMRTDQDHAMSFEGDAEEANRALGPLAEFVAAGLESAGITRCEAKVMATNEALRLSLDDWIARFEHWMNEPSPKASEQLSIVFDFRAVAGDLKAETALNAAMATAVEHPVFLRHLAHRALDAKPPIGFTRGLVLEHGDSHRGTVDLKHGGILVIGNIARAYAIRSGVAAKRTLERLRAAEGLGAIDAETREGLEEAFRFLWEVRLRHHVERWRTGEQPDDFVDPDELGAVARNGLKEAFRIVARAQKDVALETGSRFR